jgi:DNA repair protein RadC
MYDLAGAGRGAARRMVRELPYGEQPLHRLRIVGAQALSTAETLALVLGTADALDLAEDLLVGAGGLDGLARLSLAELQRMDGVGEALAGRIKAALELGRRLLAMAPAAKARVTSPADAANLLMSEMMLLEQEQLRVILLDTRNCVLGIVTVYVGSLNASVIRVGELLRPALAYQAAAFIVAHNHPSGDPSPSPEDVHVTRQIVSAGKLLDIDCLDHIIIGRQRYVSLKERGLGFETSN